MGRHIRVFLDFIDIRALSEGIQAVRSVSFGGCGDFLGAFWEVGPLVYRICASVSKTPVFSGVFNTFVASERLQSRENRGKSVKMIKIPFF